jgi:hypothetical protein
MYNLEGAFRNAFCTWPSEHHGNEIFGATFVAVKFMIVQLAALPSQVTA